MFVSSLCQVTQDDGGDGEESRPETAPADGTGDDDGDEDGDE